ncbi:MAG: phosphatidate cytidylyltransferase [Eubacterium sp.]|nr:phosphatidate cytidylyltransferase [Eubacterium sp.]MDD7209625.1 phosphatidate cytidylyltransferase [Lachnospiraceae bacterium]MDY5497992.1 phosphatidate cytidylyltransferase [Anaerobutyricum sp.]
MFKERLLSGIVLVIIAFVTLYFGGFPTFFVVAAISLIGVFELLRVIHMEKSPLGVIVYSGSILYYLLLLLGLEQYVLPLALLVLIMLIAVYVFTFPKYEISSVAISFFALFYVTVMLSCIYRIRMLTDGGYMVVLVFLSAWGNDTLAYCTGRLIGRHKMSPILSPKKTIEGAAGGVIGAGLLGCLYGVFASHYLSVNYNLIASFGIICAVGGLISIIGDLGASAIKRNYEIKDYSHLIPGHGGILDRFDSIIFTAPIIYYMLVMVVGLK